VRFQVYPRNIWIDIDPIYLNAIEASMSGATMIMHAPGLQIPVTNGHDLLETFAFKRDFIEMSPARWIRFDAITSMQRFGDDYVRVLLDGVRQAFDLFSGDAPLRQVYNVFRAMLPLGAPTFEELDVAA
jgi:hypothetical protein